MSEQEPEQSFVMPNALEGDLTSSGSPFSLNGANGYIGDRVLIDHLSPFVIIQPETQELKLSDIPIGRATVEAYGYTVSPDTPIVIDSSFNTPASTGIIPGIMSAAETNHETTLAATTVTSGEIAIIPQQVGGGDSNMVSYWRRKGVTPVGARIIQVPLHIESNGGFHYPHTDALQQAFLQEIPIPQGYLVSSFPHDKTKEVAEKIGLIAVQEFDPAFVGSKINFHKGAEIYKYPVAPAMIVTSLEKIRMIYENFMSDEIRPLFGDNPPETWIKFVPNSSGGEEVKGINFADFVSWDDLEKYIMEIKAEMYTKVKKAFLNGNAHSEDLEEFWPQDEFAPNEGLLIEADMNVLAHMDPKSYSNTLFIARDGRIYEIAEFEQLIGEGGKFLGSFFKEEVNQEADSNSTMGRIGRYLYDHGVRGFIGTDYKKRKLPLEQKILIEPNVRLSLSEQARRAYINFKRALAQRGIVMPLDMTFANTVFEIPQGIREVRDMEEFYDNFACPDINDITIEDLARGVAISIGNGSFVTDTGEIVASTETRTLIIAPKDKIQQVMQEMKTREEKEKERYKEAEIQTVAV